MAEIAPRSIRYQFGGRVLERHGVLAIPGAYKAPSGQLVEAVTRGSVSYFLDRDGIIRKAANNKVCPHYLGRSFLGADGKPLPAVMFHGTRTNGWATVTEDYGNAAWTKSGCSITSNATTAPDAVALADKFVESGVNELHELSRAIAGLTDNLKTTVWWLVKGAERTWCRIKTRDKGGTERSTWFNLATGVVGTKDASHDVWCVPIGLGFCFVAAAFPNASGATTPVGLLVLATGDAGGAYAGDGTSGIYVWESGVEVNNAFPSAPGSILPNGMVRSADVVDFTQTVDMTTDWSLFLWFLAEHSNVQSWSDSSPQTDPLIMSIYPGTPADTDNAGSMLLHRQNGSNQYEWEYWVNRATAARTFTPGYAPTKMVLRHHASDHHLSASIDNSAFAVGAAPTTVTIPPAELILRMRSDAWISLIYGVLASGLYTQPEFEALPAAT